MYHHAQSVLTACSGAGSCKELVQLALSMLFAMLPTARDIPIWQHCVYMYCCVCGCVCFMFLSTANTWNDECAVSHDVWCLVHDVHFLSCRQHVYLSMACRNPRRGLLCEPPAIKRIDYYCHSDLSLAAFIVAAAPHAQKKCQVRFQGYHQSL